MNPIRALEHLYARSRRLPVRVRIAIVSSLLTAFILIGFAAVVGRLVSDRLHADFASDLQANAAALSNGIDMTVDPATQSPQISRGDIINIEEIARTNDASITVVDVNGNVYLRTEGAPELGRPTTDVHSAGGGLQVASSRIISPFGFTGPMYVQYARPEASVDDTVGRLWLFLGGGVAIGSFLAGLAGMAIASRAMRPISALTGVARKIATTRDPSLRIPEPETDDEVAELARTLDEMLRELDAARTETEETIKRQREFVADASHELRTPLTSVLANLEMLEESLAVEGPGTEEDERAAVASALRSSRRMKRLVADLLMLARADAGRLGAREPCDLAEIAAEALEEVRPVAGTRTLDARMDAVVPISGSPDEIHRMVLNLLENAIRHTPDGTSVQMVVSGDGETAHLVVEDDGTGLPPGMESQVFDRFVQGQGPADRTQGNGTGTGLGLSIVKAVATAHGGSVSASNRNGATARGARFEVQLPQV